jgi:hypothetical protein
MLCSAGVCHGDELFLLFKPHAFPFNSAWSATDKKVRSKDDFQIHLCDSCCASHAAMPLCQLRLRLNFHELLGNKIQLDQGSS